MRDVMALIGLVLGFIPWLLFLFLSGNSLPSLQAAILVSLLASIVLGFKGLRKGFILTWGTLLFFGFCAIMLNLFRITWFATHMDLLANGTLASIMWLTILAGQPFALQYAQEEVPKEQWSNPHFIEGCRFISLVWAWLMTLSVALSFLKRLPLFSSPPALLSHANLFILPLGFMITVLYKRRRRLQCERATV